MPKTVIVEGKTSTEAIEKGLKELKVSRNQVDIKILEEKKKSFFNILEPHIVKVELTVRENVSNKENFTSNSNIGNNFKFPSPWGFNTSIYESLKQTLNDPSISPENSGDPVIYTVYLSTFTK